MNMTIKFADLEPKLKTWSDRFALKIAMCPIFMKFNTQSKQSILIMNKILGIDNLDPKLLIRENLVQKLKCAPIFMRFGTQAIF